MKYYKITKYFKGGFNICYAGMSDRKQMKRNCWEYQLEEFGEATDGGHNYGYRITAVRVKSIPRGKGRKYKRLGFNEEYLVSAVGSAVKRAKVSVGACTE